MRAMVDGLQRNYHLFLASEYDNKDKTEGSKLRKDSEA
jgi:hypothetical protein